MYIPTLSYWRFHFSVNIHVRMVEYTTTVYGAF